METITAEVHHLQVGQQRIETKLDQVADALSALIRLTERHDALTNRVENLEKESARRSDTASRGEAYMAFTKFVAPLLIGIILTYCSWMYNKVGHIATEIQALHVFNAQSHPGAVYGPNRDR